MESLNRLPFTDDMEFTSDKIENDINLFPSLFKFLQCLRLNVGVIKKKNVIKNKLQKKSCYKMY